MHYHHMLCHCADIALGEFSFSKAELQSPICRLPTQADRAGPFGRQDVPANSTLQEVETETHGRIVHAGVASNQPYQLHDGRAGDGGVEGDDARLGDVGAVYVALCRLASAFARPTATRFGLDPDRYGPSMRGNGDPGPQ